MKKFATLFILFFKSVWAFGQTDSSAFQQEVSIQKKWYQNPWLKSSIVPAALIGYGISVYHDKGIYSSFDARQDILDHYGDFNTRVDDYLIWVPYAELGILNLLKVRCKNDRINTSLLILKSQLLMAAIVLPVKHFTKELRPDGSTYNSLPSGHTANAFVAASIIHKEFAYKSIWPGIGAYAVAASVAAFRMFNNRHWQSDVLIGAGIGMFSVHAVYLTHKWRWGTKGICFFPVAAKQFSGFAMIKSF